MNSNQQIQNDFAQLLTETFGIDFPEEKRHALLDIQTRMLEQHELLNDQLERKIISPEEYLDSFNKMSKKDMRQQDVLLGREDFLKLYGEAGLHPEGMIDRDMFLSQFA